MTDHEVERALGYTPCVCGVIDGTWHWRCYRGKTDAELKAGIALAFRNARRHLKKQRAEALPAEMDRDTLDLAAAEAGTGR
jgi:hypothetical protein